MCLSTVTREYKRPLTKVFTGYKWFATGPVRGKPNPFCYIDGMKGPYDIGDWYESVPDRRGRIDMGPDPSSPSYPSGFHIFRTKDGAKAYWTTCSGCNKLYRVEYTRVVATGRNGHSTGTTDIAREMRILGPA